MPRCTPPAPDRLPSAEYCSRRRSGQSLAVMEDGLVRWHAEIAIDVRGFGAAHLIATKDFVGAQ